MMGDEIAGGIIGDHASKFYHLPNSPNYNKAPQKNRELFQSVSYAPPAAYGKAKNCR